MLYDHLVFIKQLSAAAGQHGHCCEAPQLHAEYCPLLALDSVQEDQVTTSPVTCLNQQKVHDIKFEGSAPVTVYL